MSASVFRVTAVAEACSWLGLLIGMFFKYVVVENEIGVKIFGPIHGALFVAYLTSLLWVAVHERWRLGRIAIGAAAAIPPFTSVIFERWVAGKRTSAAPRARL
jgi:integral membrane protein